LPFGSERRKTVLRKCLVLASAVIVTALAVSSKAHPWGGYRGNYYTYYSPYTGLRHVVYTGADGGNYGNYYTYYSPYTGLRHVVYTGADGAYGRYYGGYHYGYGYSGAASGAARYGYYRAW
jgi:hypothetical protein